ncbi:MAG: hypothetical protein GXP44_02080 [bacterium]|nr:hypothetical protein [bacterium]
MEQEFKQLLQDWQAIRQLTLDLLDELPEKYLSFTVGRNMGTIGKQYRHIGDVQICYTDAIKTGKIDFSKYKKDYSLESSQEKLKTFLQEVNREMLKLIKENPKAEIDWFGEKWNLKQHTKAVIEHEILHQGELIVYIRILGLKFPKSWKQWGL